MKKVSADETTIFVYDASGVLIAEYSGEVAAEPQVSYLTTDHLGSPRVVTDERGSVTSRRDFTAFGEESFTAQRTQGLGYQPTEIRQNYTGYEKDEESGLEFAQARYYNPTHGRFTSVDPLTASATIRNPQTFNRYSYGLNSPYKFTDPLGLAPNGLWQGLYANNGSCSAAAEECVDQPDNHLQPVGVYAPRSNSGSVGVGEFVQTGTDTFIYGTTDIPTAGQPATVNNQRAFVEIYWERQTGYVLAADGVLKIEASRASSDIKVRIVDSDGKEFTAVADLAIVRRFSEAITGTLKRQGFTNASNCHGTTFADGRVWIDPIQITNQSLSAMGYRPLAKGEKPIAGDAALYYDGSSFLHSATYNADGTVRSKGGIEPLFLSAKPGPGKGTAWNRGGSIQVWTTRATVSEEKK